MAQKAGAVAQDIGQSFMSFELNTNPFKKAELRADGTLYLEMAVSPHRIFHGDFVDSLKGEIGIVDAERLIDDVAYEMNRQIAVRLLLKK